MKQQSFENFEYTARDIENLVYEDIRKHCNNPNRARVKINFSICSDPTDTDYQATPRQIFDGAKVTVDVTK